MGPPPTPLGGVPASPIDFSGGSATTDAIQDMACRFTLQTQSDLACTRNNFGNFSYVVPATTRMQYCYQVPSTGEFGDDDTVIAIQLRDVAGNLGPKKEIVVRVTPP